MESFTQIYGYDMGVGYGYGYGYGYSKLGVKLLILEAN